MKPNVYLLMILVAGLLSSCEQTFETELPEPTQLKLVLNGQFTTGKPISVSLKQSRPVLSTLPFSDVTNAHVALYEDGDIVDILEFIDTPGSDMGYYVGTFPPSAGKTYVVEASAEDFVTISAQDLIPERPAQIRAFNFLSKTEDGQDLFEFKFRDEEEGSNYYHLLVHLGTYDVEITGRDTSYTFVQKDRAMFSVRDLSPQVMPGMEREEAVTPNFEGMLINDMNFDENERDVRIQVWSQDIAAELEEQQTLGFEIELRTISEAYYLYQNSISQHLGAPTSTLLPPGEIYNNVENGFGNFSSYSVVYSEVIIEE